MSSVKRKLQDEHCIFQDKWELLYFCMTRNGKIDCLICNNVIAIPKEYNIKRHYETHCETHDKYTGTLREDKLREMKSNLLNQQTLFFKVHKEGVACVKASYALAELIASNAKPYTEGDFIKQCIVRAAEIVCPEKAKAFKDISLTRNTVADRIDDMAGNLREQFRNKSIELECFSIAIDESTDVTDIAQLAIFIRACDTNLEITEELLELVPLHDTTTSVDIFNKVEEVLSQDTLPMEKLVCLATDGAATMLGYTNGVGARLLSKIREKEPDCKFAHFHCIIHQQSLCLKVLKLGKFLKPVTQTVNFISARGLNHRQFTSLLEDVGSEFDTVLYYTEVHWLSCHKVLKRFFLLREEITLFLEMKEKDDLAFAVDLTGHLYDLNLKLQGKHRLVTTMYDDVKSFQGNIRLWTHQGDLENENLVHFPTCQGLKHSNDNLIFGGSFFQLELLSNEFSERFRDFSSYEQDFALFTSPYSYNVENAPENIQMELIEVQSDSILKAKYNEVGVPGLYAHLPPSYVQIRKLASRVLSMFGRTYLCEQLFSLMKATKTPHRSRLTVEHLSSLIKVAAAQDFKPDIDELVTNKRCQVSGQKK
uniref:SPIN-DOC-like zinc-finger domain-containing protein n=1 Tax=Erpetoichthys calabaricus TaxID=27687 RepID=A0A8C4SXG7_ERPCA